MKTTTRHRSAKSGEFVTKEEAVKSPFETLAEKVEKRPKFSVINDIARDDLSGAIRTLAQENVILCVCRQKDGRYTIAVERV